LDRIIKIDNHRPVANQIEKGFESGIHMTFTHLEPAEDELSMEDMKLDR